MSEIDGTRTICIPSLAFNYVDNRLESIGYQGEIYVRQLSIHAEFDYIDDKSRWFELFGTPERAARTLEEFELDQLNWCHGTDYCEKCPYEFDSYGCCLPDGFSLLGWLEGGARCANTAMAARSR